MKKTYIQPTVKIHSVRTSRIMAGSTDVPVGGPADESAILGKEEEGDFGW